MAIVKKKRGNIDMCCRKQENNNKKFKAFAGCLRTYICSKFVDDMSAYSIS